MKLLFISWSGMTNACTNTFYTPSNVNQMVEKLTEAQIRETKDTFAIKFTPYLSFCG